MSSWNERDPYADIRRRAAEIVARPSAGVTPRRIILGTRPATTADSA